MADFVALADAEVVAEPVPVPQTPGPFHPTSVVVEIIGTEMDDRGRCEEHRNCGEVMGEDMVVCLRKVQIQVEGREETAIAAYWWVTDSVDRCRVGFLQCHMVKQAARFNGALAQVTHVFNVDPTYCDTAERRAFHKNKGCCRAAIIAWYK